MNPPSNEFAWLPEALELVALRLTRADQCAFKIGDLTSQWSLDGPLGFKQVRRGGTVQMILSSLRPIPPEASLLFSEAVNHLRAAIDNVVWFLVEQEQGDLTGSLAAQVSLPIVESQEDLDKWTRRRSKITALASETTLGRRVQAIQPFAYPKSLVPSIGQTLAALTGQDVEMAHPLRLLQAYSNADKHRAIRLAAARTFSSTDAVPMAAQNLAHHELKVGDALGPPTPWGEVSFVDTNTAAMVQRPDPFSAWVNPVKDLNAIRRHVSKVVIPILLTGLEMPHGLPPGIETGDNGASHRERLLAGGWEDAETRLVPLLRARFRDAESRGVQFAPVVNES
ncbi:hypothetical protein Achl_1860 [Pseudarthrobacter chlorophenolicus A6]|uniref:Uncharacterized protein n=1 Tax=Pseudarthrobacter chlorophenolicus (strain ATCC 700700 / DSM 12829 / CIP 107037 / JCM 12360 / KCTC 9906 / NCIMB 13794 / A6) TaxID=452863 RepID=B8H7Q6_PSECP|nr:hypothetical protein [Pseudarthrobacter chlorophenolicus]ACL39836.1 hypothetical protein Achl_1860 [Pseudarthrobacter chlorophenolicus A6]SDQ92891.1 hypothetical protein SAMN04489738_3646 [Pseudarthrobacter chlorophenolicus]